MTYYIHFGYAAIAVGRFWIGVAAGNRHSSQLRRTPEKAISDAKRLVKPKGIKP